MTAWTLDTALAGNSADNVTLVEGSTFCISAGSGDFSRSGPHGLFYRDTRILSRWDLRVDGDSPEPLTALTPDPYRAVFLARVPRPSGRTNANLLVRRERRVGDGMREDIILRNMSSEPTACMVTISIDADFADLFEVKEGRIRQRGTRDVQAHPDLLLLVQRWRDNRRGSIIEAPAGRVVVGPESGNAAATITYQVVVDPRREWTRSLLVRPIVDQTEIAPSFPLDRPVEDSPPARRLHEWQQTVPMATVGHDGLRRVLRQSQKDLGALRIFDPEDPSLAAVAAGAPWFMALFGRDSLLAAFMALPVDRSLALGTLRTLARHQGIHFDRLTEEEPGRILHEIRLGVAAGLSLGGGSKYFGTVDATPLFVILLGEIARWGARDEDVQELLVNADRALEWVERYGDRDQDGFVEYRRATDIGLRNQGWKDSWDGITFADGRPAEPPIALCEVQGYVYDAYLNRAALARAFGDEQDARRCTERAEELKAAFNDRFWLPDRGWYAVGLDRDKRPIDACASNMGHCLWSGIVDDDKAAAVADRLMSPEMFTGWGVRTLSSAMGAYDPVSYHNGSVWPHDNALVIAGLMRYGFVEPAQRVAAGIIDAAQAFGGRLPELFSGFDREEYPEPIPYPTSCSPQAWAAAAPVHIVRTLLRFRPSLPTHRLWVAPALPARFTPLRIQGVSLGDRRISMDVADGTADLQGLPKDLDVRHQPWSPVET